MCGRYNIEPDNYEMQEIIKDAVKNLGDDGAFKTGEIFPTNRVPVLLFENKKPKPLIMDWGFPNFHNKGVIINARAETALEKRTFHNALINRRCVIPSTGFYEWSHTEDKKTKDKYLFNLPQSPMLYMAGLYSEYEKDGITANKFVILTTTANESMKDIHDRMPVVLTIENIGVWIKDTNSALDILQVNPPDLERTSI